MTLSPSDIARDNAQYNLRRTQERANHSSSGMFHAWSEQTQNENTARVIAQNHITSAANVALEAASLLRNDRFSSREVEKMLAYAQEFLELAIAEARKVGEEAKK